MGWEIYPQGLYHLLNRLHFEYRIPKLYITENGCSYATPPDVAGRVPDQGRLDYLRRHFTAAHDAMQNGVPLAGYFVWSLMDNFEWAMGYTDRFGIVWVDFDTQERIAEGQRAVVQGRHRAERVCRVAAAPHPTERERHAIRL